MSAGHLIECAQCRAISAWTAQPGTRPDVPASLLRTIQDRLKESLAPVSAAPGAAVLAGRFFAAICALAAAAIPILGVSGVEQMTPVRAAAVVVFFVAALALACMSLAWQMSPGSLQRYSAGGLAAAVAGGFALLASALFPWLAPEEFLTRGVECAVTGVLAALPAAVLIGALLRRGVFVDRWSAGLSLGALAGLAGTALLELRCTHQDAAHQMVWHGAVLAVCIGAGLLAGVLRSRAGATPRISKRPPANPA